MIHLIIDGPEAAQFVHNLVTGPQRPGLTCSVVDAGPPQMIKPKPKLALVMIVRNEARTLPRLLQSVVPYIDYWVITDTGSTDGTVKLLEEFKQQVPGEIRHDTWVNFGVNRTKAIQAARGRAEFLLLLDADDTLVVKNQDFKQELQGDGYYVRHDGAVDFALPRLVSGDRDWKYLGVTHEYLTSDQTMQWRDQRWLSIMHHADGGCRADKFTRDIALLEQGLAEEPHNTRYMFYLAQSYKDAGRTQDAIRQYRLRAEAGGWEEEIYISLVTLGKLLVASTAPSEQIIQVFSDAYAARPTRSEAPYELAKYWRETEKYAPAAAMARAVVSLPASDDLLFVDREVEQWRVKNELAICEFWLHNYRASYDLYADLLQLDLPAGTQQYLQTSQAHSARVLGL